MWGVWEGLQLWLQSSETPENTHWGEALWLRGMWKNLRLQLLPHPASEASSEEEALSRAACNCGSLSNIRCWSRLLIQYATDGSSGCRVSVIRRKFHLSDVRTHRGFPPCESTLGGNTVLPGSLLQLQPFSRLLHPTQGHLWNSFGSRRTYS